MLFFKLTNNRAITLLLLDIGFFGMVSLIPCNTSKKITNERFYIRSLASHSCFTPDFISSFEIVGASDGYWS